MEFHRPLSRGCVIITRKNRYFLQEIWGFAAVSHEKGGGDGIPSPPFPLWVCYYYTEKPVLFAGNLGFCR